MEGGTGAARKVGIVVPKCCPPAPWLFGQKDHVGCIQRPCSSIFCCFEDVNWGAMPGSKCEIQGCKNFAF